MSFDEEDTPAGEPEPDQIIVNTQELLRLTCALFDLYCEQNDVPEQSRPNVNVVAFLQWFSASGFTYYSEAVQDLCAGANAEEKTWNVLVHMAEQPLGANLLQTVWPQVVLAHRAQPKTRVDSMHLIALIKWMDGRAAPLSCYVPRELCDPSAVFDDGKMATVLQMQANSLVESVRTIGLDHLHDFRSQMADEGAFDALMGLILMVLNGAPVVNDKGETVKLGPHTVERCTNVFRLLQAMFRPPLPPEIRAQIEARRAAEVSGGFQPIDPPEIKGGWDG